MRSPSQLLQRTRLLLLTLVLVPRNTLTIPIEDNPTAFLFSSPEWTRQGRADPHQPLRVLIGLQASDPATLEATFWNVSNPRHAMYGQYLTKKEADALSAPSQEVFPALHRWLEATKNATITFEPSVNVVTVSGSVRALEELFDAPVYEFAHHQSRRRRLAVDIPVRLPQPLESAVTFISLVHRPMHLRRLTSTAAAFAHNNEVGRRTITPHYLKTLYGVPLDAAVRHPGNVQGVAEFFNESYRMDDLEQFNREMGIEPTRPRIVVSGTADDDVGGGTEEATPEATLDVQYLTAMAPNATTVVMSMSGLNPFSEVDEPFVEWAHAVLDLEAPPLVFSLSFSDDELHVFDASEAYARSFDPLLMKMGLRGISVVFASGDDGVSGQKASIPEDGLSPAEACVRNGPQWPTSSPFVLTVGATMQFPVGAEDAGTIIPEAYFYTDQEVVCSSEYGGEIVSGGAFSDRYPQPLYQAEAVQYYVETYTGHVPEGFFNRHGRAYPDVAAYGSNYRVIRNGEATTMSGTSASTPVVAAMITLWNDRRLNAGKPPLGFINPLLYALARVNRSAFFDVAVGNNGGTQDPSFRCAVGFEAAPGWDAATGLGTPNFPVLAELTFEAENLGRSESMSELDALPATTDSLRVSVDRWVFYGLCLGWVLLAGMVSRTFVLKRIGGVNYSRIQRINTAVEHAQSEEAWEASGMEMEDEASVDEGKVDSV